MMNRERQEHHDKIKKQLFCHIINYKKETMKPDHSTTKGYPYDIIISRDRFKYRLDPILDHANKGRILLNISPDVYPDFKGIKWIHRKIAGSIIDFLFFRIFDYAEALHVAEQQIEDLLLEAPFIPEEFGFVKILGPKDVTDNPVKIYTSKYNDNISIFRNLEEECEWILIEKGDDSAFKQTKLHIPNHRIAYAAFTALSIKIEEINNNIKTETMSQNKQSKFKAVYYNGNADPNRKNSAEIIVTAENKSDAMTQAKFIFETDKSLELPTICEFHHITITEEEGSTAKEVVETDTETNGDMKLETTSKEIGGLKVETADEDLAEDLGGEVDPNAPKVEISGEELIDPNNAPAEFVKVD